MEGAPNEFYAFFFLPYSFRIYIRVCMGVCECVCVRLIFWADGKMESSQVSGDAARERERERARVSDGFLGKKN